MPHSKKYFTEEERKTAHRAVVMRYQARNREKVQARQAAYREENRNKVNAYAREYWSKNRERLRALKRAYYERNKAKINAKAREKKAAEKAVAGGRQQRTGPGKSARDFCTKRKEGLSHFKETWIDFKQN